MASWLAFHLEPRLRVHAIHWPVVTVPLPLLMMRPLKAAFLAVPNSHMSGDSE